MRNCKVASWKLSYIYSEVSVIIMVTLDLKLLSINSHGASYACFILIFHSSLSIVLSGKFMEILKDFPTLDHVYIIEGRRKYRTKLPGNPFSSFGS